MADLDQDERCAKRPRRGCVALAESSELSGVDQHVIVGDCIRGDAAERSGLLSGIVNTDGLASLPAAIRPEDVQLWQAACVLVGEPSTEELITIIRVADALGDSKLSTWTHLLGRQAARTDWKQPELSDDMTYSLLSLPHHLLNDVLLTTMKSVDSPCLLIPRLPFPLHSAILTTAIERDQQLLVPTAHTRSFEVLATTALRPPGLVKLLISGSMFNGADHATPKSAAALLARALAAHPSITQLRFANSLPPQWLTELTACLAPATLPSLSTLEISVQALFGGSAAIARCLKCLPSLRTLSVNMQLDIDHEEQPQSLSTLRRSAACPAALTCLTELYLRVVRSGRRKIRTADAALLQLLPLLHAPALTRLALVTSAGRVSADRLCFAIHRFTALQVLHVNADISWPHVVRPQSPREEKLPPMLKSLEVCSVDAAAPLATAVTLVEMGATHVTQLSLRRPHEAFRAAAADGQQRSPMDHVVQCLALSLTRLPGLLTLRLEVLRPGMDLPSMARLAKGLSHLTALTELSLQSDHDAWGDRRVQAQGGPVLVEALLGHGLRQLQSLQRLRVCSALASELVDQPSHLLLTCAALRALTHLAFLVGEPDDPHPDYVLQQLPKFGSLRSLVVLPYVCRVHDTEHLARTFPYLDLEVEDVGGEYEADVEVVEGVFVEAPVVEAWSSEDEEEEEEDDE
eukprot:jgi/Ulvmu1/3432/UM016_0051.1